MALHFVDDFDREDEVWSFCLTRVMFDDVRNAYRIGRDSGCSCPTPFEDFNDDSDWGAPMTAREAVRVIRREEVVAKCIPDKLRCADVVREHAEARFLW